MDTSEQRPACLDGAELAAWSSGTRLFQVGDECRNFIYLMRGSIRVDLTASSGRAIMLYRFGAGETCILTTSCLLGGEHYSAEAHTESDAQAYVLHADTFQSRLAESAEFRKLVFASFSSRLTMLMDKVEQVAFTSIDTRLASRLLVLSRQMPDVSVTHEQLAIDIGSAREVISRKLGQWENRGWIARRRGSISVLDLEKMQIVAAIGD